MNILKMAATAVACMMYCMITMHAHSQNKAFIRLSITDSNAAPITSFSVQLSKKNKRQIVAFANVKGKTDYLVSVAYPLDDTLLIKVSSDTYQTAAHEILPTSWPRDDTLFCTIKMMAQLETLLPVEVKAATVWTRGDTTFFKADAFKNSGDKKLKDIIGKMPGFGFDENGKLRYENRLVEKMTIDGEEIFADKQQLLLNTFPIHVLDQVQALQNQTNNPLLRGLQNENRTFINLKLKNDHVGIAFGDAEAGAGTQQRYVFQPTIFSVKGKWKGGFVGNYNSLGTGFDFKTEQEVKTQEEKDASQWNMNDIGLTIDNNLSGTRYIRNRLFDNRLQINWPGKKRLKSITSINFIRDRQSQETALSSLLLNGNSFFKRVDKHDNVIKPSYTGIRHVSNLKNDSSESVQLSVYANWNNSGASQQSAFMVENMDEQANFQQIKFNGFLGEVTLEQTKRFSAKKADRRWVKIGLIKNRQQGFGYSPDYPFIFNLPPTYMMQTIQIDLRKTYFDLGAERLLKAKKQLITLGIKTLGEQVEPLINNYFSTKDGTTDSLTNLLLQNPGKLSRLTLEFFSKTNIPGKWPIGIAASLGAQYQPSNNPLLNRSLYPIGSFDLSTNKTLKNRWIVQASFKQVVNPRALFQQLSNLYPSSLVSFKRFSNYQVPEVQSTLQSSISYRRALLTHQASILFNRNWNGNALYNRYVNFIQIIVDSFNTTAVNGIAGTYTISNNNMARKFYWQLTSGLNAFQQQYSLNGAVLKSNLQMLWASSVIQKTISGLRMEWRNQVTLSRNLLPTDIKNENKKWATNFKSSIKAVSSFTTWLSGSVLGEYFWNSSSIQTGRQFFVGDVALDFHPTNKSYSFSLKGENLLNASNLQSVFIHADRQSALSLPLIPRNVMLVFRHQW